MTSYYDNLIFNDVSPKTSRAHLEPRDGLREALRALGPPLLEPHGPHGRDAGKGARVLLGFGV